MMKNGVFGIRISSLVSEISKFLFKIHDVITVHMPVINSKIEDVFENIACVLFKLSTSNVHQIRHKVTPIKILPWQLSRC